MSKYEDMPNLDLDGIEEFSSVPQMKVAVTNSGSHWFDKDTMRFFNSKVETGILQKRFFITSERQELSEPKRYTIRFFMKEDEMLYCYSVGEFQQFETLAEAKDYLKEYLAQ